jgi:hypothetical protein
MNADADGYGEIRDIVTLPLRTTTAQLAAEKSRADNAMGASQRLRRALFDPDRNLNDMLAREVVPIGQPPDRRQQRGISS